VTLNDGSDVQGTIFGNNAISGRSVLTFNMATADPAEYAAALAALVPGNAGVGTLTFMGVTYAWQDFDELENLISLIVAAGGGSLEITINPVAQSNLICDDGVVKVFRLPNGDADFYSGFAVRPVNGFLTGIVELMRFPTQRNFQDSNSQGWFVNVFEDEQNGVWGQVHDDQGNRIGAPCKIK